MNGQLKYKEMMRAEMMFLFMQSDAFLLRGRQDLSIYMIAFIIKNESLFISSG